MLHIFSTNRVKLSARKPTATVNWVHGPVLVYLQFLLSFYTTIWLSKHSFGNYV